MPPSFRYRSASTIREATAALADDGAAPMGGGTDLLASLDHGFITASLVVDLRRMAGAADIATLPDGSVRIGATARIHGIATHELITSNYRALAESCASVGTPALREMGTIGGNLCQRPRCWYLRQGVSCYKSGGDSCPAVEGENQYHAILEGGPCYIVHPSDPAVALTALDALVEISGGVESRLIPIADFYVTPAERLDQETVLGRGEIVTAVVLPAPRREERRPIQS